MLLALLLCSIECVRGFYYRHFHSIRSHLTFKRFYLVCCFLWSVTFLINTYYRGLFEHKHNVVKVTCWFSRVPKSNFTVCGIVFAFREIMDDVYGVTFRGVPSLSPDDPIIDIQNDTLISTTLAQPHFYGQSCPRC